LTAVLMALVPPDTPAGETDREIFTRAWRAAAQGDRAVFDQLKPALQGYLLYPYLQYEDLRHRRAQVEPALMADFLARHRGWAFTAALETAWLKSLGASGQWDVLLRHAGDSQDTHVRCYLAQARIARGQTDGLLSEAQSLWTVGQSQPDACDPVFDWLREQDGISAGLAWERIRRAMDAREPRLALYLKRYLHEPERIWADRWYRLDRGGYRQLDVAAGWPANPFSSDIADFGLRRLARDDADRAWQAFGRLEPHFTWPEPRRAAILREIALWSAVAGAGQTAQRMQAVPVEFRDGRLLEWWLRYELGAENWTGVTRVYDDMSREQRDSPRWRYWAAVAHLQTGAAEQGRAELEALAREANYHGFLAADRVNQPYALCNELPAVEPSAAQTLRDTPGIRRALELRRAGVSSWARSEWQLAVEALDREGLRGAAALAVEEGWHDMAIAALGDSGDLRWYEWRFPIAYAGFIDPATARLDLDPSWGMGLMRSESAMAEDARSPAGARGLMQLMPQTALQLARRHPLTYRGNDQLMQAEDNIAFGTTYLRELLDRFGGNLVLASGAYNAGPNAVDRWLDRQRSSDPAIWIETLPYFETRDYIPRVLAFATIYDWRRNRPVVRVTARMSVFDSGAVDGTMQGNETAEVACRTPG